MNNIEIIRNLIRREVSAVMGANANVRFGKIQSFNGSTYSVKVQYQPDGTVSGWMPIGTFSLGPGWGMFIAPVIGTQCVVDFQEGDHETPYLAFCIPDANNPPPPGIKSGEMWLYHQSGSYIKLTNDGKITLNAATEIDAGNLANGVLTLATSAIMAIFNNHVHTNGNNGANTGVPTTQLAAAQFTTVLKAN